MKSTLCVPVFGQRPVAAQELVKAKDGSDIYGYKETLKLSWCNRLVHDLDRAVAKYKTQVSKGPLAFGGHGCPMRFRNVWVRPL